MKPTRDNDQVKLAEAANLSNRQLRRWMYRFVRPVIPAAAMAVLYLVACDLLEIATVNWTGRAINKIKAMQQVGLAESPVGFWRWLASDRLDATNIRSTVFVLAGMVILFALFRYLREVANTRFSMNMVFYIREAVYDKLQHVGFKFHDNISTGQLINRALSDLNSVRNFLQNSILTSLDIVLIVSLNIANLVHMHWWTAMLAIVPIPIWVIYILRFSKLIQPMTKTVLESEDRNVSIIAENIAGVHVIKAFATEQAEVQKYGDNCGTFKERVVNRMKMHANFMPIIRSVATASHLSMFMIAGILIINGKMEPGNLLILGATLGMILGRLQQVAGINEQYQNAIVSARRLYEVLHAPSNVPEKTNAIPLQSNGRGAVVFDHVAFGYDPEKPVLNDISFKIKGGSVVAIVGPTGGGKTTLVSLIARFYDPQKGSISIDGIDVRDLKLASLRTQVSFVFQETYLFSLSVAENISYGRPGISMGDIESAARLAQAHEFIEQMPKGYDSILGERGQSLSGGQRQRVAIARAILTNPRILILDDATAAIDPETEDLIRKGMRFVMKDRTTFVIAHRISTVKQADVVIVLEKGRVTQIGTHDELVAQEGHYREIALAQLSDDTRPDHAESPSHMKRMYVDKTQKPEPQGTAKDQVEGNIGVQ